MKNLKKVLALVLAFAMAFTMMATAGAAYTDSADIQATEAVDMLSTLGIMAGDPDGSFRPNDTITRAEACRMIYSIRTNSDNADAYKDMQTTFKDVPADAWYAGYVKHCQAAGIVSGTSATTFEPNRDVTGVELALMCLRVMGYDPAKADIGGSTWSTKTISIATEAGILDGVNTTITAACPRQWAAQLMYNMIQANTVQWSDDKNGYSDQNLVGKDYDTVGVKYLKLYVNIGTLSTINGQNLTISQSASDKEDSDTTDVSFTKLPKNYSDLLGHKVKVMFRDQKTNDVIGVYPIGEDAVYNTRLNQTERDGDKIKFDGKSYTVDDANKIATIIDGATAVSKSLDYFDDTAANKVSMNTVTFVDTDENGKIDTAIVTTYTDAEVTYVGSDKITAGGKSYDMDEENIDENLAKDDYAVISENLYDSCKDIVKAEVITGELTGYKEKDDYVQYELNGNWYNMATEDTDVSTGDTVKAYVFNGVVLDLDTDDGTGSFPGNIVVVTGVAGSGDSLNGDQIKVRYFDGSSKTVTLDDDVNFKPVVGVAYKSSGSDNSFKIEKLEAKKYNGYQAVITDVTNAASQTSNKKLDADPSNDKIGGIKVDDNAAIVLFDNNGRSKQITGKQFNAMVNSDTDLGDNGVGHVYASFTKESNGLTRVMMASVLVNSTSITGKSSDNYGYIVTDGSRTSSGDTQYTIWTGSENVTVTENTSYSKGDRAKGTLIGYSTITNGVINDVTKYGTVEDATNATGSLNTTSLYRAGNEAKEATKYIAVNGNQFNVTADTTVLLVDSKADNDNKIGLTYTYGDKLPQAEEKADGTWVVNAFWLMNEAGSDDVDIEVLVIDSTGVFDGMEDTTTGGGSTGGNTGGEVTGNIKFGTIDMLASKSDSVTFTVSDLPASTGNLVSNNLIRVLDSTKATVTQSTATIQVSVFGAGESQSVTIATGSTGVTPGTYTLEVLANGAQGTVTFVVGQAGIVAPGTAVTGTATGVSTIGDFKITTTKDVYAKGEAVTAKVEYTGSDATLTKGATITLTPSNLDKDDTAVVTFPAGELKKGAAQTVTFAGKADGTNNAITVAGVSADTKAAAPVISNVTKGAAAGKFNIQLDKAVQTNVGKATVYAPDATNKETAFSSTALTDVGSYLYTMDLSSNTKMVPGAKVVVSGIATADSAAAADYTFYVGADYSVVAADTAFVNVVLKGTQGTDTITFKLGDGTRDQAITVADDTEVTVKVPVGTKITVTQSASTDTYDATYTGMTSSVTSGSAISNNNAANVFTVTGAGTLTIAA
ncbi:S-layer homology domain-containing protein [Intestinibacillus sp. Marseille-P6563]|uniref:S-layer homology domain-containing protein n=1 Tax=Intestinibacillus sp. Marseille-P6563 TaxID=2364792 RepID=UPI000F048B25|nr:S-layer homology domain-containing protein [Intestinibacillus sp. Marseille-P6563]